MKINWLKILFMCIIPCNCHPIIGRGQIYITHARIGEAIERREIWIWSIGFETTDECLFWSWWLWFDATPSSFPNQHSKIRGFMINYIYIINSKFTYNVVITWNFMGKSWWCKVEGKVDRNWNNCFMFFPNLYVMDFSSI